MVTFFSSLAETPVASCLFLPHLSPALASVALCVCAIMTRNKVSSTVSFLPAVTKLLKKWRREEESGRMEGRGVGSRYRHSRQQQQQEQKRTRSCTSWSRKSQTIDVPGIGRCIRHGHQSRQRENLAPLRSTLASYHALVSFAPAFFSVVSLTLSFSLAPDDNESPRSSDLFAPSLSFFFQERTSKTWQRLVDCIDCLNHLSKSVPRLPFRTRDSNRLVSNVPALLGRTIRGTRQMRDDEK